jgi:signal transduction histidine kinase
MKKVALVFVVAVLAPSLVLAWLAVRSLRDQQFLLERQQALLDQQVTDALARNISDYLAQQQQDFSAQVESLAATGDARTLAAQFDDQLRRRWPLAEVGFCVTAAGKILSPLPNARPQAQRFRLDNSDFLGNREPVEVYLTANNFNANAAGGNASGNNAWNSGRVQANQSSFALNGAYANPAAAVPQAQRQQWSAGGQSASSRTSRSSPAFVLSDGASGPGGGGANGFGGGGLKGLDREMSAASGTTGKPELTDSISPGSQPNSALATAKEPNASGSAADGTSQPAIALSDNAVPKDNLPQSQAPATLNYKAAQSRKVSPQSQRYQNTDQARVETAVDEGQNNLSKVVPAEAEFRQLIGEQTDGILARFLQNKLKLMCWHRLQAEPDLIFGAQLNLDQVVAGLRALVQPDRSWGNEICLTVLDDNAKPVVLSRAAFQANWKRPFVATELGEALPHWEAAAYLVNPAQLLQVARTAKLTLGLLVAVLLIAIGTGSLLIVRSLGAELKLARQKTDFVGNVSHELKTPLTSIRMFSELLAEGRVADPAKQRSYLQIITAEAARLTRLINNVLDFSRMERGEKKYNFQACDLTELVRAAAETFRPHLESSGFQFVCELPATRIPVRGDADALSQIIVNLLSNAEKYSGPAERRAPPRLVGVQALACSEDRLKPELQGKDEPGPETAVPPKEIVVQLAQKQSPLPYAEIKVLDRGPGVPRGCEEKVFEKFYRAHDSLSSGVQGSGLGLTIARQIARAHGGEVLYEPRDGGGSCFVLRLPIQTQATTQAG